MRAWIGVVVGLLGACGSPRGEATSVEGTLTEGGTRGEGPLTEGGTSVGTLVEGGTRGEGPLTEGGTSVDGGLAEGGTSVEGPLTEGGTSVGGTSIDAETRGDPNAETSAETEGTANAHDDSSGAETGGACQDDHRVVAFVANWEACPTTDQLAAYSHIVIAFAVTYTWSEAGNLCDPACALKPVEGCTGATLSTLVEELHTQGKEVLVSFGGAGMGGVWEGTCGEMVKCWDACLGRAEALADQLAELVDVHGLDGVDIDYEYCLSTPEYREFLEELTLGLRERLDASFPGERKRITHAPMDREVDAGEPYYEILQRVAPAVDFLMPQYYNGGDSPFTEDGLVRIEANYDALVEGVFGGDASRVTVGFCIEPGCQPVASQPEALEVIRGFDARYPDHGGVFFWAHPDDVGGSFSAPFRAYYDETVCRP